jgi:hypothetical protein
VLSSIHRAIEAIEYCTPHDGVRGLTQESAMPRAMPQVTRLYSIEIYKYVGSYLIYTRDGETTMRSSDRSRAGRQGTEVEDED